MSLLTSDDLSRIPAEPPRRPDLLPGLGLSRALPKRVLAFPLVLLAAFALMPLLVLTATDEGRLAFGETERAEARVESAEASPGCGGAGTDLVYSFTSRDGLAYKGRETVCPRSPYAQVQPGDTVPIEHLKSDPGVSAIADGDDAGPGPLLTLLFFPLFPLLFVVPIYWPRVSQLLRDRKLFRSGTLARGRVRFVARQHDAHWPGWPVPVRGEVYVAVGLPSGEDREVKAICTNDWLLTHLPPDAEVTVCLQGDAAVLLENYLR
jgi:hypothetical protein